MGGSIKDVFRRFCDHFAIVYQDNDDVEKLASDEAKRIYNSGPLNGGQLVLDIHQNSTLPFFRIARAKFTGTYFANPIASMHTILQELTDHKALFMIGYRGNLNEDGTYDDDHVVVIFKSKENIYKRDPEHTKSHIMNTVQGIGTLTNGVLFKEI